MHIPFLPRTEVDQILEEEMYAEEFRGEFIAEQGSSYFFGGMTSADAMLQASIDLFEHREDFARSEEGELYFARLDAATLYDHVDACRLLDRDIPEFTGRVRGWPGYDLHYDDIPF